MGGRWLLGKGVRIPRADATQLQYASDGDLTGWGGSPSAVEWGRAAERPRHGDGARKPREGDYDERPVPYSGAELADPRRLREYLTATFEGLRELASVKAEDTRTTTAT
jgi:hypothetical protein